MKVILPMPPSLNQAYPSDRNGVRHKSKKYNDWIEECDSLRMGKKQMYFYPDKKGLRVDYKFYSNWLNKDGTLKKKDVSNYVKAVEDYLPQILIGFDDSYIIKFTAEKRHSNRNEVEIIITDNDFKFIKKL